MKDFFKSLKNSDGSEETVLKLISELIADEKWLDHTSKKDIHRVVCFLTQTHHKEALKKILIHCLNKISKLPGDSLFSFIAKNETFKKIPLEIIDLDAQHSLFKNYMCPYELRAQEFKDDLLSQYEIYEQKHFQTKNDLLDKLEFARTQRLEKEVKKTLEKLIEAFPEDPRFIEEKNKDFEKDAAKIIDQHSKNKNNDNLISRNDYLSLKFTDDNVYELFESSFEAKDAERLLELFLLSGDDYSVVRTLENNLALKKQHFWIYIQHLLKLQRYLEAFAELKDYKSDMKNNDDEFNNYYFTAICLWHLNDKKTALDFMQTIGKIKPNFRQTLFYLSLWQHYEIA